MLVLTRRQGEVIAVGNEVRLTVLGIGAGQVKIGIEAPPQVVVKRDVARSVGRIPTRDCPVIRS